MFCAFKFKFALYHRQHLVNFVHVCIEVIHFIYKLQVPPHMFKVLYLNMFIVATWITNRRRQYWLLVFPNFNVYIANADEIINHTVGCEEGFSNNKKRREKRKKNILRALSNLINLILFIIVNPEKADERGGTPTLFFSFLKFWVNITDTGYKGYLRTSPTSITSKQAP